jgi:hypothetical protein
MSQENFIFTADNGAQVTVPEDWITGASLDDVGLCLRCGEERYGTEPDARRYPCEGCDEKQVYGVQELLLMGLLS